MRLATFTLLMLWLNGIYAQQLDRQVISAGGAELVKPECRLSFTIGDIAVATNKSAGLVLTQGFQQPVIAPQSAPLPVKLVYFKGVMKQGQTLLEWKTAQEQNTDYFDVEKSVNGSDYTSITKVKSKGNSTTAELYTAVDVAPQAVAYYRLKIVDIDLKFVYSPVVVIKKELSSGISLFPNPAVDIVSVSFNASQQITDTWTIINSSGQVVMSKQVSVQQGLNTVTYEISSLTKGNYFVRSTSNIFPVLQFIKQ